MKKAVRTLAISACLLSLVLLAMSAFAASPENSGVNYVPGQLLIRMNPGVDPGPASQALGMRVKRALALPDTYLLESDPSATVGVMVSAASKRADVAAASPNYICRAHAIPNDPGFANRHQWGMWKINAPMAWDLEKGKSSIIVGVADTGISMSHPDLAARVIPGRDFVNGDDDATDDNGHGTHVAGIIAASTNNGVGVAGVCWSGVRLMPLKVLSESGSGSMDMLVDALDYAARAGVKVVNMSLGGNQDPGPIVRAAFQQAVTRGIIIVVSAGNDSDLAAGNRAPVNYPGAYPEVICVSATDPMDRIANYSCVGSEVDIAAPGGAGTSVLRDGIYSTFWDKEQKADGYDYRSGTSMAAPHVAGVCALMLSAGARPADVRKIIQDTARRPTTGNYPNQDYGYGIIDAGMALTSMSLLINLERPTTNTTYTTHNQTPVIRGYMQYADPTTAQLYIDGNLVASVADGRLPAPDVTQKTYRFSFNADLAPGTHVVKLIAANASGITREATGRIDVKPYHMQTGTRLFSIPYGLSDDSRTPEAVFAMIGTNFRLARWIPEDLPVYAVYNPLGIQDSRASFSPPDAGVVELPRGLGYWVKILDQSGADILVRGTMDDTTAYRIPLQVGWNQIGNPFDFPVDWNSVQVEYAGDIASVDVASKYPKEWIRPTLYRFDGTAYQWANPPDGQLIPWEGHWVKALVPCTLLVPPLPSPSALSLGGNGSQ